MRSSIAVVALIALAVASSGTAQPSGVLVGTVHTAEGAPVPHLVLTLDGPDRTRTVVTGPDGRFVAAALPAGSYAVRVRAPGFTLAPFAQAVVDGGEARIELTLRPAPVREHVVVAASRGEAPRSSLGVSVTVLDRDRLEAREPATLLTALEEVPGLAVARSGGIGPHGSVFLRGGESNFARVLVDGVPVNEPGGEYNFGPQLPLELDRVEVVRGAASSLYGSDALAGVIHLVTRRGGPGATAVLAEAERGSFDWGRYHARAGGRQGPFDWNAGAQRLDTDNQQPNGAFSQSAAAASAGFQDERTAARMVLRAEDTSHGTPGPTAFGRPDLDASFERQALVAGVQLRHVRGRAAHELHAGYARMDWLSLDPLDSGGYVPRFGDRVAPFAMSDFADPAGFQQNTDRLSGGYLAEGQLADRHLVTVGIDVERETGALGARAEPLLRPERTNVGVYAQERWVIGTRLFATLGGRVERGDGFGTVAVPRGALALRLHEGGSPTTLRASAGAGLKEPTFFESFGVSFYAQGNPDLRPEKSRTFDLGVEQRMLSDRLRLEATAFHHDYRDQIAYHVLDPETFRGSFINVGRTRAQGLELALEAAPARGMRLGGQYTLLDGEVVVSGSAFDPLFAVGQPLLRRPRHRGSLFASWRGERAALGADLLMVGRRADSDFVGLGLDHADAYTRLDARASLRLAYGLEAVLIGENVLDRRYQEVLGYPALGRSVRLALRWRRQPVRP